MHRRDTLRASNEYVKHMKNTENLEFIWNSSVQEIFGENKVSGVQLKNLKTGEETTLECDGVFVAIGNTPNSELFRGKLELNREGYVAAGEDTKTNVPGVFAVGDVRAKPLRQIVTAVSDGAVASQMAEEYFKEI